jgi:3'-phosphoadenosine 5'-phosphosulfate sulfotransferase (PAPS reductase)/FAD synthetase
MTKRLVMTALTAKKVADGEALPDFAEASAESVLGWALDKFSPRIALACSFQAEESVLIDMLHRLRGAAFRIFTLDTGRLNQETYDCMNAIRARYGISVEVYFPEAAKVQDMVRACGVSLFTSLSTRVNSAAPCAKSSRLTERSKISTPRSTDCAANTKTTFCRNRPHGSCGKYFPALRFRRNASMKRASWYA